MSEDAGVYAFCVEVWFEDQEWNFSVIQEFDNDETEILFYGTADSRMEAITAISQFLPTLDLQ